MGQDAVLNFVINPTHRWVIHPISNLHHLLFHSLDHSLPAFESHLPEVKALAASLNVDRAAILALPKEAQVQAFSEALAKRLNESGKEPLAQFTANSPNPREIAPFVAELSAEAAAKGRKIVWSENRFDASVFDPETNEIRIPAAAAAYSNPLILASVKHELAHTDQRVPVKNRSVGLREYAEGYYQKALEEEIDTRLEEIRFSERLIDAGLMRPYEMTKLNKKMQTIQNDHATSGETKRELQRQAVEKGTGDNDAYDKVIELAAATNWVDGYLDLDIAHLKAAWAAHGSSDASAVLNAWNETIETSRLYQNIRTNPSYVSSYKERTLKALQKEAESNADLSKKLDVLRAHLF